MLVVVIVCAALVVPFACDPKFSDVGENKIGDVPLRAVAVGVGGGNVDGVAVGGGGVDGVQPDNVACAEVVPSETVTWQVEELKGCTSILNVPLPSDVPSALPLTAIA